MACLLQSIRVRTLPHEGTGVLLAAYRLCLLRLCPTASFQVPKGAHLLGKWGPNLIS